MAFPRNIDFDRMAYHVLGDVAYALNGWARGRPSDETALLNRLTEVLVRRRRGCDIGVNSRVIVVPQVAVLHRQGAQQIDRYGADLAVTLFSPAQRFAKTSFFQLKKTTSHVTQLERSQLEEAFVDTRIGERSFVFAVDETRLNVRIGKGATLRAAFPAEQATHQFDTTEWDSLALWLWSWMSCREAPSSDLTSLSAVERLIAELAVPTRPGERLWGESHGYDLPENYSPARAWLAVALDQLQSEEELFAPDRDDLKT